MNQIEEAIRQQKEYLEFLGREISATTQLLAKTKKEQEGFMGKLREKEIELAKKEAQINEFFAGVESAKGSLRERELAIKEKENKLMELHKELLENEDLSKWLGSKKLTFLERSKEELNKLNEDIND